MLHRSKNRGLNLSNLPTGAASRGTVRFPQVSSGFYDLIKTANKNPFGQENNRGDWVLKILDFLIK